jgi:hypothetical protein
MFQYEKWRFLNQIQQQTRLDSYILLSTDEYPIFIDATYFVTIYHKFNSTDPSDWAVTCAMHARLRAEDYRPMTHPLIRFLYEFRHVEFRHLGSRPLGSWGRYICYTPGRGTSWTGCRYHLAWNVGTITSSAVSWTSSTRNIRNECERRMTKHSRSNYCMSCTGHPWALIRWFLCKVHYLLFDFYYGYWKPAKISPAVYESFYLQLWFPHKAFPLTHYTAKHTV